VEISLPFVPGCAGQHDLSLMLRRGALAFGTERIFFEVSAGGAASVHIDFGQARVVKADHLHVGARAGGLMQGEAWKPLDLRRLSRDAAARWLAEAQNPRGPRQWRSALLAVSGRGQTHTLQLFSDGPVTLGRDHRRVDVRLAVEPLDSNENIARSRRISSLHARLSWRGADLCVADAGGRNGTWLDAQRLSPNRPTVVTDAASLHFAQELTLQAFTGRGTDGRCAWALLRRISNRPDLCYGLLRVDAGRASAIPLSLVISEDSPVTLGGSPAHLLLFSPETPQGVPLGAGDVRLICGTKLEIIHMEPG